MAVSFLSKEIINVLNDLLARLRIKLAAAENNMAAPGTRWAKEEGEDVHAYMFDVSRLTRFLSKIKEEEEFPSV